MQPARAPAAQTEFNNKDIAIDVALVMFSQMLGSVVFTSVGQNVFATHFKQNLMKVPGLDYKKMLDTSAIELRGYLSARFF